MSNDFGRVPFAAEMNALKAEVGSHERVKAAGLLQHSAIVANAGKQARRRG